MRFALMIEPQQGLSYADQLAIARQAEASGFETLFRSDHYTSFPGAGGRPTTDAWAVLAGLARETTTIRLGALVSPITFRFPGSFAKVVTTVDEMSGGRIDVAVGTGWNDLEHRQLGLEFPDIAVRADMLEEELAILYGLWTEPDGWSFHGKHYTIDGARFYPKPMDVPGRPRTAAGAVRPWIICGGEGAPRGLRIAARWADEFNLTSSGPERAAERYVRLDDACRAIGRDPSTIARSAMVGVLVGRDQAEVDARTKSMAAAMGADDAAAWLEGRRSRWIVGTPEEARAMVARFAAAGCERIMLQDFLPTDLDMIAVLGRELIGRV